MILNPDVSKQAKKVVFSFKAITTNHATVYLNNVPAFAENFYKNLGVFLNSELFFITLMNKFKRPLKLSSGKRTCHYHGLPF